MTAINYYSDIQLITTSSALCLATSRQCIALLSNKYCLESHLIHNIERYRLAHQQSIMPAAMDAVKRFFSSPRFAVAGASADTSKFGYKSEVSE